MKYENKYEYEKAKIKLHSLNIEKDNIYKEIENQQKQRMHDFSFFRLFDNVFHGILVWLSIVVVISLAIYGLIKYEYISAIRPFDIFILSLISLVILTILISFFVKNYYLPNVMYIHTDLFGDKSIVTWSIIQTANINYRYKRIPLKTNDKRDLIKETEQLIMTDREVNKIKRIDEKIDYYSKMSNTINDVNRVIKKKNVKNDNYGHIGIVVNSDKNDESDNK